MELNGETFVIWCYDIAKARKTLWMISKQEHIGTDNAYACAKDSARIPSDIDSYWMVYNKTRSTYEKVKTLVITAVEEEEEVEEEEYEDEPEPEDLPEFVAPEPPSEQTRRRPRRPRGRGGRPGSRSPPPASPAAFPPPGP